MSGDHISSNRKQLDIEYWRILVWGYSATTFVICSLIFLSGWCLQQNHHAEHNASQLQFISTQMGACLKKHPLVTHFFVLAMAIQMLLLFDAFLRCMKYADCIDNNITVCKCIVVSRQLLVLFCGLLIINLVISIAGVAEFCSEGEHYERIFHYVSAVSTITIFWAIHFLICLYLRGFAHAGTQLLIAPSSQTPEHAPHVTLVFTDVKVPTAHTSHLILLFALAWRALPTAQATHICPCSS